MASGTSLATEPDFAEGEGDFIHNDKEALGGNFFFGHPVPNGFSGEIHVGVGFDQYDFPAFVFDVGTCAFTDFLEIDFFLLSKVIYDFETDIVTGLGVLRSDISEAYNEVFHGRICLSSG